MGRVFSPVQTGPGAHLASCTMGTGSFPGVKYGRGVLVTTHPLLVPRLWKSRAIPVPTLWATTGPVMGTLYLFRYVKQCDLGPKWNCVLSVFPVGQPNNDHILLKHVADLNQIDTDLNCTCWLCWNFLYIPHYY